MLAALQANFLVSQKSYKMRLRWGYSDNRAFKSGENVSFVFRFLFRYFHYFLRNKITCTFHIYDVFVRRIRFVFLLYCISIFQKPHFSLDTPNSYQTGTVIKHSAFHLHINQLHKNIDDSRLKFPVQNT